PPAAIILMTSPILYPIITTAGFDPVWFGVIMTINMEIGLIHPPVGLNIYIVNSIAPDVPVTRVMWGTIPYVICMMLAIVILCIFPDTATGRRNHLRGRVHRSPPLPRSREDLPPYVRRAAARGAPTPWVSRR